MLVLCLAALLAVAYGQSSQCSFTDPSGYSLSWTTNNGQVYFNLSYPNFPTNSYTGVGFGDSMAAGIDAILVSVSGSQVQVTGAHMQGYNPPNLLNDRSIRTQSSSYNNRNLNAQFSRQLSLTGNNRKSLAGNCNTWDFITSPGSYNNGQYSKHQSQPQQKQICNIDTACRGNGNQMNVMYPNNNQMQNSNMNNQMYNPSGQYNNGPMYQPMGPQNQQMGYQNQQMGSQYPMMGVGPQMMPGQQQGQNFGYQPNMGSPPQSQPYTGAPFVYTTTLDPTWGTSNGQQNSMQNNMQLRQRDPSSQMNNMYYNAGSGSFPNQALNNPYQQQQMQPGMYNNPSSPQQQYNGYYSQQGNQPFQNQQQPRYNQIQSQNQSYYGRKRRSIRAKRQTAGYQPTNNIYGYDYSNSLDGSASTTAPIVVNPNYKYLSGPLADEYSRTYAQEVRAYDQQTAGGAGSSNYGMNLNGNAPILNNDQQNQANYQQIQRDSVNNPNAGQTYTNNIYGYNYGGSSTPVPGNYYVSSNTAYYSSTSQPYGVQRDPNQYNNNLFYPANAYSSTASPIVGRQFDPTFQNGNNGLYSSGSNLKETKLRDPNQYNNLNGVARDYIPGTSAQTPFEYTYYDPQTSLYYPYRTTSNFQPYNSTYYDDNGVVRSSQNSGSTFTSSSTVSPILYNPSSSNTILNNQSQQQCVQADPYWCEYYVRIFISSQQQYNYATQQMACQQLRTSLVDTYNGCCNTLRAAGC